MPFIISDRNLLGNYPLLMDAKDPFADTWRIGKKEEILIFTAKSFLVLLFTPQIIFERGHSLCRFLVG